MSKYAKYTPEELEEHFSNYLVDSWSFSGVSCFARNEKAFEMQYVYREKDTRSIASIAGNAYHEALKEYFSAYTEGSAPAVVDLTKIAYDYLDEVPANEWRLSNKFPSVEQARAEADRVVNNLLESFCAEVSTYTDDIAKVLDVEVRYDAWVTVNGVDIPLPLHCVIDLVVELKDGRIVVIDHKSKSAYTEEKELALAHGQQAITYVLGWEAAHKGDCVSEVWFIENKIAKNKDGSAQMRKHVFTMDADNRRLFEALLYEPLRRMLEAVSDPDYIYTINPSDNFTDMAVLYDFWARTQISEIDDFEFVPEEKRELIAKRQRKIKDSSIGSIAPKAITTFRKNAAAFITLDYSHSNMTPQEKIEHVLRTFNIKVQVAHFIEGFSCNTYLCEVAPGVELLSIFRHSLDIANALDVPRVRIQGEPLVMYEGKSYLAIEVTKKKDCEPLLWDAKYTKGHKLALGMDNFRNVIVWDLDNNTTPHLLVCGATGSGKSVQLFTILFDAIQAGIQDITILDPKYEFAMAQLPKNVRVLSDIEDIERALADMVVDMNERVRMRLKHLSLVIFDEFADAADQSRGPKELEPGEKSLMENFKMLLQKGRSAGFRFVAATQRASVKTIPGDIKVNLPVQICFRVPKGLDSKVVLDTEGAEALAGHGDGLIHSPEYNDGLVRFQGFYKPQD
jgi:hypothetical protein